MLFNVALFSSLLLVPAVLALPSQSGARLARRREGRQSQRNSRLEQPDGAAFNTEYSDNWAGAILNMGDVCDISLVYDCTRPHARLVLTGNLHLRHRDVYSPHPFGFDRGFCRRLGWYRR